MRVQIVPAYPPSISGVGDYAAALVQNGLFEGLRINTVVASPTPVPYYNSHTFVLGRLTSDALCAALEEIEASSVLLHFSGYGYARWGLCSWLVNGLKYWKTRHTDRHITTIFHETFSTGPFWRSSFWTSNMQKIILLELAHLSHAGFVTSEGGFSQLAQAFTGKPLEFLPVFSNVGEPLSISSLDRRRPQAVVFGGVGSRQRFYDLAKQHNESICRLFDHFRISDLIDIGAGPIAPPTLAGRPIRALGSLEAKDISEVLANTKLGMIDYRSDCLSKSTIAASYFAHGVLLVNINRIGEKPTCIKEGLQFISLSQTMALDVDLSAIAIQGHALYQANRLDEIQRKIKSLL